MNRIRFLRLKNNLTQQDFAKIIQVSQPSLSGYENGKFEPDSKTLLKIADIFGVSVDYLLGKDHSCKEAINSLKKIPVYLHIKDLLNGMPPIVHYYYANPCRLPGKEYFGLYMNSDCMEPRIRQRDLLVVSRQTEVSSGDIAVVQVGGREETVQKVACFQNGAKVLISYNPKYEPEYFTAKEIASLPIRIFGKVVEFRGKC